MMDAQREAKETPIPVVATPQPSNNIPAMPHLNQDMRRGPGRPPKVVATHMAAGPQDLGAPRLAPAPTEGAIVGRRVT
jgi:electron transfer flavoprotein alpha/beta subunit